MFSKACVCHEQTLKRKKTEREMRVRTEFVKASAWPYCVLFCFVGLEAVSWRPAVFSREVEREWIQGRKEGAAGRSGGRGCCGLDVLYKGRIYLQKAEASREPISSLVRRT